MKKIAIAAVVLAAGVLTAGAVESANTFVTIKATSSTTNTVIAVPLVNIGTGNAALNVTNFVLTTGLKDGATLTVKHNGTWYAFRKNNNGTWEGVYTVEGTKVNEPSGAETIARGGAAMLHNEFDGESFDFYLYGQLATAGAEFRPVAHETTVVANGSLGNCLISTLPGVVGDQIAVPKNNGKGMQYYKYMKVNEKTDGWYKSANYADVAVSDEDYVPVGKGFWYISNNDGVPTFDWARQDQD